MFFIKKRVGSGLVSQRQNSTSKTHQDLSEKEGVLCMTAGQLQVVPTTASTSAGTFAVSSSSSSSSCFATQSDHVAAQRAKYG